MVCKVLITSRKRPWAQKAASVTSGLKKRRRNETLKPFPARGVPSHTVRIRSSQFMAKSLQQHQAPNTVTKLVLVFKDSSNKQTNGSSHESDYSHLSSSSLTSDSAFDNGIGRRRRRRILGGVAAQTFTRSQSARAFSVPKRSSSY